VFVKPGIHLDKLRNYLAMNPVKASLVENASDWIWGSAKRIKDNKPSLIIPLSMGPKPHPINLEQILTDPNFLDRSEQKLVSHSLHNDLPFGDLDWVNRISTEHGLQLKTDQLVPFL
jgi:hypothetical protein